MNHNKIESAHLTSTTQSCCTGSLVKWMGHENFSNPGSITSSKGYKNLIGLQLELKTTTEKRERER